MNTQYRKNLKGAMTACKDYTDQKAEEILWQLAENDVSTSDDNTTASTKTVPANATRCKIKRIYGNSVKYAPSTTSDDSVSKIKSIPLSTFTLGVDYVGGMTYKAINLFDKTAVTLDKELGSSGAITDNSNYFVSDYIEVKESETYNYNLGIAFNTCFYDENKTYLSGGAYTTTFTIPSGAKYIRMSATKVRLDTLMICKGTTYPSSYVEYVGNFDGLRSAKVSEIVVSGNLCQTPTYSGVMNNSISKTIDLGNLPNGTYSISLNVSANANNRTFVLYYYNNGVLDSVNNIITTMTGTGAKTYTFTLDNSIAYDDIRLGINTQSNDYSITLDSLMLNKGSTAQSYIPYAQPITKQIPSEILNNEYYGLGLSSSLYNSLNLISKKLNKKLGIVDLGTLNYERTPKGSAPSEYRFISVETTASIGGKSSTTNLLCTLYEPGDVNSAGTNMVMAMGTKINIVNDTYTDTATFKQAMSGVYLVFELATYEDIDMSSYLDDSFKTFTTNDQYTDIEMVNPYNYDMPNKVEYFGTIKETLCTAIEQRRNGTLIKTITLSSNTADYGYSDNVSANVRDYTTNTGTLNVGKRAYESGDEEDSDIKTDELNASYYPLTTPTTETITPIENVIEVQAGDTLTFVNSENQAVPSDITYRIEVAE